MATIANLINSPPLQSVAGGKSENPERRGDPDSALIIGVCRDSAQWVDVVDVYYFAGRGGN